MSYIGNQPVLNTSEFREEFAVTSTQTVFNTGGFTASSDSATLEILRNGVLLGTADYTLGSDASTVTLANAAVNGDIIVIKGRRELTNGVQVTERRHEHTMGSGETTVTFPYPLTVSQTDVYLNGVKLGSSDFTINSSTRVVSFTTNPAVGDLVAIVSREPALTTNSSLPVVDAAGNNVLSESGSVVTLTADEANVGSNALVVNSSGNVGVGTSPSTKLDISDTSRLTVNVSNAYVLETSLNSAGSAFATHYENASDHIFQTAGTERMRIDSSGMVSVGAYSLGYTAVGVRLKPEGASHFAHNTAGSTNMLMSAPVSGYQISFYRQDTGAGMGSITNGSSSTVNYNTSSDYRLKENITEITDGINRVKQLSPSRFNFIDDPNNTVDGFIAHEVQGIVPEAITGEKDAVNEDGSIIPQGIDQSKLVPLLTAALQESIALIESQQSQIDALTARIEALEATP